MIRREAAGGGSPLWLITMTDLYILLMSLFFLLFAIGLQDRPTYERIEQRLQGFHGPLGPGTPVTGPEVKGQPFKPVTTSEGTVVTIGGEVAPFAEGSWELRPEHRAVIAEVRQWLQGKMNIVVVRGHTAGNWEDSVVIEAGRIRPWAQGDAFELSDPWLLSSLRADAVRQELARADSAINRRIRVRGDAFTAPIADTSDAHNRRVEIVLTLETAP